MIRTVLILAAAVIALAGCAPHRIQYYQLTSVPAPAVAAAGPVILVGRIATPQVLQDGRIRYREGTTTVGGYEYHRWTDPPGIMVKEALIRTLRASGRFSSVQETSSAAQGDYGVRGKLLEFTEVDGTGIQTHIALDLELRELKTGHVVWSQMLTHDDPVAAKTVPDVVKSMERNLQFVVNEASTSIGKYVETHPTPAR